MIGGCAPAGRDPKPHPQRGLESMRQARLGPSSSLKPTRPLDRRVLRVPQNGTTIRALLRWSCRSSPRRQPGKAPGLPQGRDARHLCSPERGDRPGGPRLADSEAAFRGHRTAARQGRALAVRLPGGRPESREGVCTGARGPQRSQGARRGPPCSPHAAGAGCQHHPQRQPPRVTPAPGDGQELSSPRAA